MRRLQWRLPERCRAGHGAYGLSLEDALGEAVAFISPAQLLACLCFEATSPSAQVDGGTASHGAAVGQVLVFDLLMFFLLHLSCPPLRASRQARPAPLHTSFL